MSTDLAEVGEEVRLGLRFRARLAPEGDAGVTGNVALHVFLVAVHAKLGRLARGRSASRRVPNVGLSDVGGPLVLVVVVEGYVAGAAPEAERSLKTIKKLSLDQSRPRLEGLGLTLNT